MLFVIMCIITKVNFECEINKAKKIKNLFLELGKSFGTCLILRTFSNVIFECKISDA